MGRTDLSVLIEFYELPRLFGFWISDYEQLKQFEAEVKERWWPSVYLFVTEHLLYVLDLKPDDEVPGRIATYVKHYSYEIDGPELVLQPLIITDDRQIERGPVAKRPWALTSDGRFNIQIEDFWWRFVPATIDELTTAGFNRELIEMFVKDAREEGIEVIEKFDEAKARELIKEARAREEAEN